VPLGEACPRTGSGIRSRRFFLWLAGASPERLRPIRRRWPDRRAGSWRCAAAPLRAAAVSVGQWPHSAALGRAVAGDARRLHRLAQTRPSGDARRAGGDGSAARSRL